MRKPTEINFELRSFSSDAIDQLLETSPNWRNMNLAHRDALLAAMLRDEWNCANGETIGMDDAGRLVNGQHRLSAAAVYQRSTGETVWFWVATGITSDAVATMDQGKNRRLADILRTEKVPYAAACACIALSIAAVKKGGMQAIIRPGQRGKPTMAEGLDRWKRHRGLVEEWAALSGRMSAAGLARSVLVCQTLCQAAMRLPSQARMFAENLITGTGLTETDPAWQLRKVLHADRLSTMRTESDRMQAKVIKAWNAWLAGDSMRTLIYRASGPKAEVFPELELVPC